jgi:tRNA G46 methylase TrmB
VSAPKIFAAEYYARMRELEQASWWNAGMRDLAARLFDGAGVPARGLLLDIGCGSGQTMAWFRDRWPEWQTVGLDVAREGLHAARSCPASGFSRRRRSSSPCPMRRWMR